MPLIAPFPSYHKVVVSDALDPASVLPPVALMPAAALGATERSSGIR